MKIRTMAAAAAALSLAAAPAVAQINLDRAAAPTEGESEAVGGAGVIIGILAVAAIVTGILIAGDVIEEDGDPVSP
jgi:hypothetical protein